MTDLPAMFGSMVFNEAAMEQYLSKEAFTALKRAMDGSATMNLTLANQVASAMKQWAISKGVTHFTHWFQPQNSVTAEKHDCFITPDGDGVIMEFSGKELIKGEPDASSLPSGGLRATFEARGYTAWDPTSYAFIKDNVLCIPTAFCSYGGHALDMKTPLLRSMEVLNVQAMRVLQLFGVKCGCVYPTVGLEQEYFLVDQKKFNERIDLIYTGRTLFGARPPKGQDLDDHYFGSIKTNIAAFMKDLDEELWRLGIMAKTEHNETAPAQHELANIFSKANLAVDQNQVTMEMMRKVAERHGMTCLLHEKPFDGVNGSGKHNNWALSTDTGLNLFEPGDTPEENAQFLTFLCAVIRAVDEYQDLLRIYIASAGNDNRLGAAEAPPAIVSMFVGDELEAVLEYLDTGVMPDRAQAEQMKIGVDVLPAIPKDTTDRNRTSPFAFTGNKFELRMLGSSMSGAACNTVLNTILAESLSMFADALSGAENFNETLHELLHATVHRHRRIVFNGNGYDKSWYEEAARRGLSNYPTTADALAHYMDEKNVSLFERHGVLSRVEMQARADIAFGNYAKRLCIEARVMSEMIRRDIQPAITDYCRTLSDSILSKRAVCETLPCRAELQTLQRLAELGDAVYDACRALEQAEAEATAMQANDKKAYFCRDRLCPAMKTLREAVDEAEMLIDKDAWPYPNYGSLLYQL